MPKYSVMTFFWRSSTHSAKLGQMHTAVAIMAADNHVPQLSEEAEDNVWQIIAEIHILLFLKRGGAHKSPPAYATDY